MAGTFGYVKVVSNTVVLRLEADDKFMEYLRGSVKKNFSAAMILRRSILILPRENERHRRKIFLTWVANLLSKELTPYKNNLLATLLNSCDMPINIQISAQNALVSIKKAYIYFEKDGIKIKCFSKQATLFSYIKATLKGECEMVESLYELKLSSLSMPAAARVKYVLGKKLFLGLDSFESVFFKSDFERFFGQKNYTQSGGIDTRKIKMLSVFGGSTYISSADALKRRYHELAKMYHPDLHSQKSERERAELSIKFLNVKEAYEALRQYVA
jgi:molecular chaperone DnaJ